MGKKSKKPSNSNKQNANANASNSKTTSNEPKIKYPIKKYPFVSVCTPTFNRRPFIQAMVNNFLRQDYPRERMEWIIIDDGTDKIGDLVKDVPCVKYFAYDTKMSLGKKRNLMHDKSTGAILVYMDDDDYYPACRVSHAVERLLSAPEALCSGSSEIYVWFNEIDKMYQFGPYGPNHATAGTFAFKRKLLWDSKYEDDAALAEEKAFLKNYTVPFVQLDPVKTILVFSHEHNTFDKRKLLDKPHPDYVKVSDKTVDTFVKEDDAKQFYTKDILTLLKEYEPGRPEMKPDVIEQTKKIEAKRKEMEEQQSNPMTHVTVTNSDGTQKTLSTNEVVEIIKTQQERLVNLEKQIADKDVECKRLQSLNNTLLTRLKNLQNKETPTKTETETENITLEVKTETDINIDIPNSQAQSIADELFN